MARLATIAALFLVLVALAEASVYSTTITATEIDNGSQTGGGQKCSKQFRRAQYLEQCMNYLQQQQQGQQYNILKQSGGGSSQQAMQQCCEQLQQVSKDCRCQGIQQIVEEMSEGSQQQQYGQQQKQMLKQAQQLPGMCQLEPQYCEIQQ